MQDTNPKHKKNFQLKESGADQRLAHGTVGGMNEQKRILKALEDKGTDDDPRVQLAKYRASMASKNKAKEDQEQDRERKVAARTAEKKHNKWRVKTAAGRGGDKAAERYLKKKKAINRTQLQNENEEYEEMMTVKIERAERKVANADNPKEKLAAVKEAQQLEQEKRQEMARRRKILADEKQKIEDHKKLVKDMDEKAKKAQDEALKQRRKDRMKASMDKVAKEKADALAKEKAADAAAAAVGAAKDSIKFDRRAVYCSENAHMLFAQRMHDRRRAEVARHMQMIEVDARPYLIIALQQLNKEAGLPCYFEGKEADELRARRAAAQERLADAKEHLRKAISRKWGTEGVKQEIQDADMQLKLLLQQESELGPHAFHPRDTDKYEYFLRRLEAAKVQAARMLFESKARRKTEAKLREDEKEFGQLTAKQQMWVKDYPRYHWRWYQVAVERGNSHIYDGSTCNFYPHGPPPSKPVPMKNQRKSRIGKHAQAMLANHAQAMLANHMQAMAAKPTGTSKSQPHLKQLSLEDLMLDKAKPAAYISQREWKRNELLKEHKPGDAPGYWHLQPEHLHLQPPPGRTGSDYQRDHQAYMSRDEYASVLRARGEKRRSAQDQASRAEADPNSEYW